MFLFCLSSSCVSCVASFFALAIFDCPFSIFWRLIKERRVIVIHYLCLNVYIVMIMSCSMSSKERQVFCSFFYFFTVSFMIQTCRCFVIIGINSFFPEFIDEGLLCKFVGELVQVIHQ